MSDSGAVFCFLGAVFFVGLLFHPAVLGILGTLFVFFAVLGVLSAFFGGH